MKHLSAVVVVWWLAIAGFIPAVAQPILILGKDANDQFLSTFWSQNDNASNLVAGVNANATIRFGTNVIEWDGVLGLLGLEGLSVPVPLSAGGTGATTPAGARAALELASNLDADLYLGTVTSLSQDLGSASDTPGAWYGSGVAGTLTGPDPDIAGVAVGDVILSNGTNWMRYPGVAQVKTESDVLRTNAFTLQSITSSSTTNAVGTAMGTTSLGSMLNASGYGATYYTNGLGAFNAIKLPGLSQSNTPARPATNVYLLVGEYVEVGTSDYVTNVISTNFPWATPYTNKYAVIRLPQTITPATHCTRGSRIWIGYVAYAAELQRCDFITRSTDTVTSTNWDGNSYYAAWSGTTISGAWADHSWDAYMPFEFDMITDSSTSTNYFLLNGHLPSSITNELHAATADIDALDSRMESVYGEYELAMPPTIWAVVGLEAHCYWSGLGPADWRDWLWEATATGNAGTTFGEDWRYTPSAPGTITLSVEEHPRRSSVWTAVATASSSVVTAAETAAGTITLLAIGDSTTDGADWLIPLEALDFADLYMSVTSIGTRSNSGIYHEGRSGWRAVHYTSDAVVLGVTNAFWDGEGFSMYHWLTENSFAEPTHVVIKLGINDLFSAETDAAAAVSIASHLGHMATIVNDITNIVSGVKIGLCMIEPTARDQDGYGTNYGSGQNGWRARRNYWLLNIALIETYGGRTAEGIYLLPTNVCIDDWYGYQPTSVPVNSRVSTTISRQSNGVHPGTDGNEQIADCIWSWLKNNP